MLTSMAAPLILLVAELLGCRAKFCATEPVLRSMLFVDIVRT
jgi:hypothetical protein